MNKFKLILLIVTQVFSLHYKGNKQKLVHVEITPWHKKSERATDLAKIKMLNQYDVSYLVELKFGSEEKILRFAVDTGSSDFLIPDNSCYTCTNNQFYDCESSETCTEKTEETYSLTYGDGLAVTHIAYDDISLGNMISEHQSFLLVDYTDGEISMSAEILGLGPDNLQVNRHKSLINNLIKNKQIKNNIFSIYLTSNYNEGSKLILGGYDTQYFENPKEEIHWFPIQSTYSYKIDFLGIDLDGTFIQIQESALLDTGTSAMTFPAKEIEKVIQVLQKQFQIRSEIAIEEYNTNYGMLTIYAGSDTQILPDITFNFPNSQFVMKPEDYIYSCQYLIDSDEYCCQTKLEAQFSYSGNVVILGAGFMQTFYTIFDKENQKIGIGRSKNENKIVLSIDGANVVAVREVQKLRADKKFNKKSKVVALGGLVASPLIIFALEILKKKKVIQISRNQIGIAFGGIFLAATFSLCLYLTLKVELK